MSTQPYSVASWEAAPAEPTLDFALQQIRNGYMAGVTLRTIANPDEPCEILVPIKLATRIGQLLLDYTLQVQRQQEKQRTKQAKQANARPRLHRPARKTPKKTNTSAIRFEFELNTTCTVHEWLHPLHVYYILNGVRHTLPSVVCVPQGYWSAVDRRVRKPRQPERRQLAFTDERIKRANAQLVTLQSRVKVAYLSLPEDQRTADNVQRLLTGGATASSHQNAA